MKIKKYLNAVQKYFQKFKKNLDGPDIIEFFLSKFHVKIL